MNPGEIDPLLASGVDYVNVVVSRDEIEACDVREVVGTLRQLLQTPDRVHWFRHRVSLFIDGYNADARELYEIPEVRAYMTVLDEEFPYWFWFLNVRDSSLLVVAASCCDLRAHRTATMGQVSIEPFAMAQFAARHFDALNRLAHSYGIPEHALAEISGAISQYFGHSPERDADPVEHAPAGPPSSELSHEEFVRRYRAGELDVRIPEEMVDEVLAKRDIQLSRSDRRAYIMRRTAGALAWVLSMLSFITGRLVLGGALLVVGVWLIMRNDKSAGEHVLSAVLRDRKLYDLLRQHHALWISER
jgi:hypothetical protein